MIEIDRNKILEVLDRSTINVQKIKWMEENAELIQAIAKDDRDAIHEELSDVIVCVMQIVEAYNLDFDEISTTIDRKLDRTLYRLKTQNKADTKYKQVELDLKLCPRCGARPKLIMIPGSCDYMYFIECTKCNHKTKLYDTATIAADHWDRLE